MSMISSLFMFILMLGGGGGDVLDLMSTSAYWHAKEVTPSAEILRIAIADNTGQAPDVSADIAKLGSADFKERQAARQMLAAKGGSIADQLKKGEANKDPEIAGACTELLAKLTGDGQAAAVRKLMSIRTLGEMKDKDSIAALKKLTESKENFVADYATRALHLINGDPVTPAPAAPARDADYAILPKDTGTVVQARSSASAEVSIEKLVEAMPELSQPKEGQKPEEAKQETVDRMTKELIKIVEMTGDMRIDSLTVGISSDVGPMSGWVTIIAHGQFDRDSVVTALKTAQPTFQQSQEEKTVVLSADRDTRFLFPSNDMAVMLAGPTPEGLTALQTSILAAIKAGKGDVAQNADLAALLKQVDHTKDVWGVMQVPPAIKMEIPMLADINTLLLQATRKGPAISYEIKGTGDDAAKVADAVKTTKASIDGALASGKEEIAQMEKNPQMMQYASTIKNAMAMMETIKVSSDAKTATLTGDVDLIRQVIGSIGMSFRSEVIIQQQPANLQPMPR